jgi:hypothetical protein
VRLSLHRRLTEGVRLQVGVVEHPALGCSAAVGSLEALELGLVSQRLTLGVGGQRVGLPPWFTPSTIALPPGTVAAALATLRHQATGMAPLLAAAVGALSAGLVSASSGLIAPAALGLLLLGSVLIHELGHVVAYRALFGRSAPALVVVRGASCHVVRRADDSGADVAVVVAGGLAPALVAVAALPFAGVAPYPVLLGALVAVGHLAALALPFGDGASLRAISAARRRRSADGQGVSVVATSTRRRTRPRAGS